MFTSDEITLANSASLFPMPFVIGCHVVPVIGHSMTGHFTMKTGGLLVTTTDWVNKSPMSVESIIIMMITKATSSHCT